MNPRLLLPFLLVLLTAVCLGQARSQWVFTGGDEDHIFYIDRSSASVQADGTLRMWVKNALDFKSHTVKSALREQVAARAKEGASTEGYEDYSYSLILQDFDCKGRRTRLLKVIDYNSRGKVLSSQDDYAGWSDIVPESIAEALLEKACSRPTN